jgi:hypothetical protein
VLKEHTAERLFPNHRLSFKPMGLVLLLSGAFGILYGIGFLIGNQQLPNGSETCSALCGLILLAAHIFGAPVAKFFAYWLWSSCGVLFCFTGYKLIKSGTA